MLSSHGLASRAAPPHSTWGEVERNRPPTSAAAAAVANRILERASRAGDATGADGKGRDPVAAAERALAAVAFALSRWFGPYGYHALISRAVAEAARTEPALANVKVQSPLGSGVEGLSEAARVHGKEAVHRASLAIVTDLAGLLARLIGEDLAMNVLEQSIPASNGDSDGSHREENAS